MAWDIFIILSVGIYFGIAIVMILSKKPRKADPPQKGLAFGEWFLAYSDIPALRPYVSRDGKEFAYRHYPRQPFQCIKALLRLSSTCLNIFC